MGRVDCRLGGLLLQIVECIRMGRSEISVEITIVYYERNTGKRRGNRGSNSLTVSRLDSLEG